VHVHSDARKSEPPRFLRGAGTVAWWSASTTAHCASYDAYEAQTAVVAGPRRSTMPTQLRSSDQACNRERARSPSR
jgi:hypothetical protein